MGTAQPSPRSAEAADEPLVLHVEDQRSSRRSLQWALRRECDIGTVEAADFFHAIEALKRYPAITCVVADWDLVVGPDGLDLLDKVAELRPEVGRVLLSGKMNGDLLELAKRAGHEAFDKIEPWPTIIASICRLARRCARCNQPRGECICGLPRE